MAKQVKTILLVLANGETRMIQSKTCTENYVRKIIADLWLPAKVTSWKVV